MKKIFLLLFWCLVFVGFAMAQRTVMGTIIGDDGEPLIGATVKVKGTNVGTVTDINGKYSIAVPANGTSLVISYTGYETQEIALGASNVVDVTMAQGKSLDEVVVTALGIKREKKALGYASTVVSSQEIAEKPETDVARALIGRSPGVNILNSSGLAGSGTKINIRGTSTLSGNSQPLWIVDGVPVNTSSNENNNFREGNITPTRNLDLDPNNIESISILRGLSATTLYGSQGRNGVILVTTKTGAASKKRYYGSVNQSLHFLEAFIPEYQNKWGNGFDGDYGEFFSNWGYVFDGKAPRNPANGLWFRHPYWEHRNIFPEYPEFALDGSTEAKAYVPGAVPNNVKDFFQTGHSRTTSVQAGVSNDLGSLNVSYSHTGEEGFIKNNNLTRNNFSLGGVANISKKLSFNGTFSIVKTDFKTPPVGAGLGSNSAGGPSVFANLFYTPRNIDLMNWPYQNPNTGASVYYRNGNDITNPRWLLENARQGSYTDRFMTNLSANYSILDWMRLTYRFGLDSYNENQEYYVNRGASGFPSNPLNFTPFATGLIRNTAGRNTIYDHTILLNIARQLNSDWDIAANVGVNGRQDDYNQSGMESTNQVVFNLFNPSNFTANNSRTILGNDLNYRTRQIWLGAYADVTMGFRNFLYVNLQGRNDWSSAHEKANRSLFYPGGSIAFIPTDAFSGLANNKVLNFMKIRVGYGTSANFADPYSTRPYLTLNSNFTTDGIGQVIALSTPSLLPNPDLKPELLRELEGGIETRMFDNRIGLDLSLYSRISDDQIVERQLDPSTGYNSTFINAGTISNKGIELGFSVTPLRMKDLTWNLRANFTRNISKVEKLPEGSKEILIPGGGFSNLGAFAIEGQPYSVIQGTYAVRSDAGGRTGQLLITENGDYKISSEIGVIADPNPKFLLSGFTDLNWKGFTLFGQVDYVHRGQLFSYSAATLVGRGVAKELEDFNPTLPVILPGILEENGQPNTIPQPASGVFFGNTIIGGGPDDRGVFDGTRLRLREIGLTYNLPKRFFGNSVVQGVNITAIGNNLWFRAFNTPKYSKVDPDRTAFGTGNAYGIDFLGGPSAKRYGVNVKVTF